MEATQDNDPIPEFLAQKIPPGANASVRQKIIDVALRCPKCAVFAGSCSKLQEDSFRSLPPFAYAMSCSDFIACKAKFPKARNRTWYGCFNCGYRYVEKKRMATHVKICCAGYVHPPAASRKRSLDDDPEVIGDDTFPTWEMDSKGDKWLEARLLEVEKASVEDIEKIFPEKELESMFHYWIAEHFTPGNGYRRFGGMNYLVGRAFQKTLCVAPSRMPTYRETEFHFQCFIQFLEGSNKQRTRASTQYEKLQPLIHTGGDNDFFRHTKLPDSKRNSSLYGYTAKDCMWKNLPVPPVENVDGIAYVSPINILKYAFSLGIEMDLALVNASTKIPNMDPIGSKKCHHIQESIAFKEVLRDQVLAMQGLPENSAVFVVHAFDWGDGFGANRTKQNRKSVVVKSITYAPPEDKINTGNNTFAVAVGSKSSPGWAKIEHKYRIDMQAISDPKKPVLVYHGKLKKIFPVHVKLLASLEDKPERADVTDTLSHTSNCCRRFRVACNFIALKCKPEVKVFLQQRAAGFLDSSFDWGWSSKFIQEREDARNSARLPSCNNCRANRIRRLKLMTKSKDSDMDACAECQCADWDMDTATNREKLSFPAPPLYPQNCAEGGPDPPIGREAGLKELFPVDLTFPFLIQAVKFAFYNWSRPNGNWNKTVGEAYLQSCGINERAQEQVYKEAFLQRKKKEPVDFSSTSESLGGFKLKASWLGQLDLERYIELLMHQLFLGLASANFLLITAWTKDSYVGYKDTIFRSSAQPLLKYVKKFRLSWLEVHPFNEGAKKTTGAWVSENWLSWVRLSKVAYGWCYREGIGSARKGSNDVQRLVVSFVALVAQLLTHSGVSRENIELIDGYTKEFMSCVRELDVHVRHEKWGKKSNKKGQFLEPWHMRSNYMSLFNLVRMVEMFGPLINLWDGGGKGKRFIQVVKPHIPRGVADLPTFFQRLMERIYKMRFLDYADIHADAEAPKNNEAPDLEEEPQYSIDDRGVVRLDDDLLEDDDNRALASSTDETTADTGNDNSDSDDEIGDEEDDAAGCRIRKINPTAED